jgi:hypothetical protein
MRLNRAGYMTVGFRADTVGRCRREIKGTQIYEVKVISVLLNRKIFMIFQLVKSLSNLRGNLTSSRLCFLYW